MAGLPNWETDPEAWFTLVLGGKVLPGTWDVDCPVSREVDVKKTKGKDGATLTDNGYNPAQLTLSGRFLPEEFEDWQETLQLVHPRQKGGLRNPLEIEHPKPNLVGITNIYITEIGSFDVAEGGADHGVGSQTLKAVEWFPQPKKSKGTGALKSASNREERGAEEGFVQLLHPTTDRAIMGNDMANFFAEGFGQ